MVCQSLPCYLLKVPHAGIHMQSLYASAVERETEHSIRVLQVTVKTVASVYLIGMRRSYRSGETTLALRIPSS